MKKITLYIALLMGFIYSCKKTDDPILEDPDVRLNAQLAEDQALLLSAQNGWKATIYPNGGKGFTFYLKFKEDGSVTMMSDFDSNTASKTSESTYRLKALQLPTLIFDTYNYIHLIADPDGDVNGGPTGKGLLSDFQFSFTATNGDTTFMTGIHLGNHMTMVKLSSEEEQAFLDGNLKTRIDEQSAYIHAHKYPYFLMDDNTEVALNISGTNKSIQFSYLDADNQTENTTATYAVTLDGLELSSSFTYGDVTIQKLLWDNDQKNYYANVNGNKLYVSYSTYPLIPLVNMLGYGKDYTAIDYNVDNMGGVLGGFFDDLAVDANDKFQHLSTKRTLNYITMTFNADNLVTVRFNYTSSKPYNADVTYTMSQTESGEITFLYTTQNSNANLVNTAIQDIKDFLETHTFQAKWIKNTINGSTSLLGGLVVKDNANQYFYGAME